MAFSTPVIMYHESPSHNGIIVGRVRSGMDRRLKKPRVRFVAFNDNGNRLGTYDGYREASQAVKDDYLTRYPLPRKEGLEIDSE